MPSDQTQTDTLIIGASISGLASAAALQHHGIGYIIIEKSGLIAGPWHNHYERLHLHTSRRLSALPYMPFPKSIPLYPSRLQVIDYLDSYRRTFNIQPLFNTQAMAIEKQGDYWLTTTSGGVIRSSHLIMATGAYGKPKNYDIPGLPTFPGRVLHSYDYKTGRDFKGLQVLVVGFGNSACEIAIDLYEQGAVPSMSVRSPVNIVPRDIFGIPVLEISLLLDPLPPRIADMLSAPLTNRLIGNLDRLGLQRMPYGPLRQIQKDGKPPVLDIGTIRHIRDGHIRICPAIDHVEKNIAHFINGQSKSFDAIIACIGYERDYGGITGIGQDRIMELKYPISKQKHFGKDGLYFCGYHISPTGQIHEIAADAKKIAAHIAVKK